MNCIFCCIVSGTAAASRIAENDHTIVIQDIHPKAPIHYLIIPKKHIQDIQSVATDDLWLLTVMISMAQHLSVTQAGAADFKLHINSGVSAGQVVMHLHMHFIAGRLSGQL